MIFKESPIEVGGETDAFCASCKTDTQHTVVTVFEGEIRSVQCSVCGASHAYRPPRGDLDDEVPEPIAVRRRQSLRKRPWPEVMADHSAARAAPYSPASTYTEGDIFRHGAFGLGYASEVVSETKFEGTFEDGPKILVHNRPDLATRHLAATPPRTEGPAASRPAAKRAASGRAAGGRAARKSNVKTEGQPTVGQTLAARRKRAAAGKRAAVGVAPKRPSAVDAPRSRSAPKAGAGGGKSRASAPKTTSSPPAPGLKKAPKPARAPATKKRALRASAAARPARASGTGTSEARATARASGQRSAATAGRGGGRRR
ncbi:MAG: hypothetical protein IPL40_00515 [Proteobacteria bacterium]|nr:hypothetical protein [Pseudomonadota bacterium]